MTEFHAGGGNAWLGAPMFAQADNYRHLGRRFQTDGATMDLREFLVAAVVLLTPLLLLMLLSRLQRLRERRRRYNPAGIFGELCRAHGLTWRERRLLQRAARRLRLEQPAFLFLDPQYLDMAQAGVEENVARTELEQLQNRLF